MSLSRRQLASSILTVTAANALAQTQAPVPTNPDEELKAARDRIHANTETLSKLAVPMDTEPALRFKA
jgi:hypothetical protein